MVSDTVIFPQKSRQSYGAFSIIWIGVIYKHISDGRMETGSIVEADDVGEIAMSLASGPVVAIRSSQHSEVGVPMTL